MIADPLGPSANSSSTANGEHAALSTDIPPNPGGASPGLEPNGSPTGRDARGRFTQGNRGGPGNPFARQTAALHRAFRAVVGQEKMEALAQKLTEMALAGNLTAMRLLLSYTLGKPQDGVNPDTLDLQEWSQLKQAAPLLEEMPVVMKSLTAEDACNFARAAQPLYSEAIVNEIGEGILRQEEAEERRRERREERRQRREEWRQRRERVRAEREAARRQMAERPVETRQPQQPSPIGGNGSGRFDNMTAEEILDEIRSGRYLQTPATPRPAGQAPGQGARQRHTGTDANGDNGG